VTKANLKLNTKKLYRADGHAVKELLKLSSLLMTAIQTSTSSGPQVRHTCILLKGHVRALQARWFVVL